MTPEDFVEALRRHVREPAIADTIETVRQPPGRRVSRSEQVRASWFVALSPTDRAMVLSVVEEAVDHAIFGMLAALDGSRPIAEPGWEFELAAINTESQQQRALLTQSYTDLHDLWNARS